MMRVLDQEPMETLHLYVVPEDQLPPKRDYFALCMVIFCSLFLIGIIALSLLAPSPNHEVSFSLAIQGYALAPVSKTVKVTAIATGRQHIAATTATGTITFYNGAIYTQIIPFGTVLKGSDGIAIITDEQAVIPAAQQTTPPTYGQVSVSAHALTQGIVGNIRAGDINEACCVTSVIAQNASFHGGRDASTYTYLSDQDVQNTTAPLLPMFQVQTLSLLPRPQLNPTCTTTTTSTPTIGKETTSAVLRITETCKAFSYAVTSVKEAVSIYSKHFGRGTLTHVQFSIVGVTEKKGVVISLYVIATWNPIVVRHFVAK
jgi:Baseplate J-like protein